ncbi:hypothetical protein ANCCAN_15363 [Ancylostoma caninum]|uniref:Uncharacterized protein n=1 Tax=Ancylostoma caninum TaxID=29170 RepID=A0A368G2L8_ANCCA|nr:hypothetical protein ANCCAN_15363 [Ancylostoma caninum]
MDESTTTATVSTVPGEETTGAQTTTVSGETLATAPPSETGSEAPTTSASSQPGFVTEVSGEPGTTSGNAEQTTTSPVEASGEEPVESNKLPKVGASMDESAVTASTVVLGGNTGTETTPVSGDTSSIAPSSAAGAEEIPTITPAPQPEDFVTEVSGEPGKTSGIAEQTTASPFEASGEEPVESNKVPKMEASTDENTSSATMSSITQEETGAVTNVVGHHFTTGSADTTTEPSFVTLKAGENRHSSTTIDSTLEGSNEEEDSIINRTLVEQPHKSNLPINVGFVPGSEPDTIRESGEDEEESEKTESPKQLDYEDAVTAKELESTVPTTSAGTCCYPSELLTLLNRRILRL